LLPVGDKPVVHHIVNDLVAAGITDIVFVVSDQKKALIDYFSSHPALESALESKGKNDLLEAICHPVDLADYSYVYQNEQL
jgi:UTP--glucose-1-phosphate uridylyltransferase